MKLYHGTNQTFEAIDLQKSKPNKDFGKGFYLSADSEQALNMAHIKVEQQQCGTPMVMEFDVDEEAMNSLHFEIHERYDRAVFLWNRKGFGITKTSRKMIDEKEMMKDDMVTKLAVLLIENGKAQDMTEALDTVINSETYQRVMDDKAALYYQSPRYVFDFLRNELSVGKVL